MTLGERRALRGVVIHLVRRWRSENIGGIYFRRDRGHAFWGRRGAGPGLCVWCRRPVEGGHGRWWHAECVPVHAATRGQVKGQGGAPLIPEGPCAECGSSWPGLEIEHHLPLAIADEMGIRFGARARLIGNLRWLCRACHAGKTRRDRALLARLRNPPKWIALSLPFEGE